MQKITSTTIIKKGDKLIAVKGYSRTVMSILDDLYFLSEASNSEKYDILLSKKDLIDSHYSLDTPVWSPKDLKDGMTYWHIIHWQSSNSNTVEWARYLDDAFDRDHIASGNCYQTKESAEARLKEIMER